MGLQCVQANSDENPDTSETEHVFSCTCACGDETRQGQNNMMNDEMMNDIIPTYDSVVVVPGCRFGFDDDDERRRRRTTTTS
jgi:hypothetical protein